MIFGVIHIKHQMHQEGNFYPWSEELFKGDHVLQQGSVNPCTVCTNLELIDEKNSQTKRSIFVLKSARCIIEVTSTYGRWSDGNGTVCLIRGFGNESLRGFAIVPPLGGGPSLPLCVDNPRSMSSFVFRGVLGRYTRIAERIPRIANSQWGSFSFFRLHFAALVDSQNIYCS